jgi:hypothetical protein
MAVEYRATETFLAADPAGSGSLLFTKGDTVPSKVAKGNKLCEEITTTKGRKPAADG